MAESKQEENEPNVRMAEIELSKEVRKGLRGRRKKIWMIAMIGIFSVLVIEAVAIVIVGINKSRADEQNVAIYDGEISLEAEAKADEYMEKIREEMANTTSNAEMISVFQNYVDEVDDVEVMIALLNRKIDFILSIDFDKEFGVNVLDDAKKIDGFLQTLDSARQVWSYASYYENKCVMNEYQKIIDERGGDTENVDEETIG